MQILHRRLAARNVLLTADLQVKVAGFGPQSNGEDKNKQVGNCWSYVFVFPYVCMSVDRPACSLVCPRAVFMYLCLLACLSLSLFLCMLVRLFVSLSVCLSALGLSSCIYVYLPAYLSLFLCMLVCLFVSLSVCLSACLTACLPACLPVCYSSCLSASGLSV